jgi:hypothetical protein
MICFILLELLPIPVLRVSDSVPSHTPLESILMPMMLTIGV